jgi:RNA polymerase sigma-70 factor (ECF subfamily)
MQQRACAVGEEDVLSFFDHALPEVYGYLFSRTRQTTAEDLTSETMLAAVRSMGCRPPQTLTVAWLIGSARHKLVDHWRRESRERRNLELVSSDRSAPGADVELEVGRAHEALAQVNTAQRMALTCGTSMVCPLPRSRR